MLTVLRNDLNCSDAYVDGALVFDDPNKQFITWEQFEEEVDGYCDLTKLPKEAIKFIASRQGKLGVLSGSPPKCVHFVSLITHLVSH